MVETTAYFEAYQYVLQGLKELEEDNLPFQRYIVECNGDVQPPAYLEGGDLYDLSCIADPQHKQTLPRFHSLNKGAWPRKERLGLDESQMEAFQLAITKELAIIQGPPGTGKTYVGLKIAQALLTNQDLWKANNAPMLVVCYTNHALDQFLEGIHSFLERDIVRIGSRSNSEILKQFNLRELTSSRGFRHSLPGHLRHAYNDVYRQLCDEEKDLQYQSQTLECSMKGVLHKHFLRNFILHRHWENLCRPPMIRKKFDAILEWLGLGSTSFHKRETEDENEAEEMEVVKSVAVEHHDLIDITEEADLIQLERIIDDSDPREAGHGSENKDDVRMLEEMMLVMNMDNNEIQQESNAEWKIQPNQKRKMKNRIRKELNKTSAMTEEEERAVDNIWILSLPDRWRLYRLWVARCKAEARTRIVQLEAQYQNTVERLADVKRHEDLCVLKKARVIGMTTTGAAKYRSVLQEVKPPVVIVEEAAEVLEAHTITTLSQACKHLILIGDHQQLRPSATVYDLAKNFSLEMSMFERLVKMGLPYVRLNYQHRMRPEIATLLTPHIYTELENHPSVFEYDNIKGLNTNVFFVEHNHREEEIKDGKSHQNRHEATYVVALCRYLLLQDYQPHQITILTTYTGQLYCLRNLMPAKQFTGVKVHVVDKYQGEENDIILLSLVRSNPEGKVGFLSIPNRVCVALSRAKKGLYCIGDSAMLKQVKLWSDIFHTLREKNQIGNALTLCCQNHPDRKVTASCAKDFEQAPEGGCTQPCEFRLDCGHVCTRVCHPYDPEHKKYKCPKKCPKILCTLGHKCPLLCYRKCPEKCPVGVEKIIPQCQHKQMVPCHQDPNEFKCQEPCQKLLDCGHLCNSLCGEECTSKCKVNIILKLRCGHTQKAACFYTTQEEGPVCRSPCTQQLKCGHACPGTCGRCHQGRFHMSCSHQCDRLLICSHKCKVPCNRNCPPCQQPCQNRCIHSKCMLPCWQPCTPCIEPCIWQCPHQSCTKLCHEPCDRPPCTQPCSKALPCGHPCIGLCGDPCPTKCRVCNYNEVTEVFFGTEEDPEASFIQLEDCGHIIEHSAMDIYMEVDGHSQINGGEEVAIKLKECPKCRTPIRKNRRYGSHINRCLAEIEMVKQKIHGNLLDMEEQRAALQKQWGEQISTLELDMPAEYIKIEKHLGDKYHTANDLWSLENKMDFLIRFAKLRNILEGLMLPEQTFTSKALEQFKSWLDGTQQRFTEQQVFDLKRELQRLILLTELEARCSKAEKRGESQRIQAEVQTVREVLEKNGQFTELDESRAEDAMKDLDSLLPSSGLGITEEERNMIVSTMKMAPGHWYKCPNGHVYVITECGGAMESRQCPDCSATIGGDSHRLASGNNVATEMDGSLHPAWSENNNLLNYDDLNI
ncbi:hypothetical protein fugu_004896 [Takifugu bimaculatus]|uniref:RZ-type domain-containing protein n=1 Tax=Takifugu bimaculatus TaxID=433685 RepID=A0A4Z2B8Z2_9TELE|nr:hypothetical protein fugu_004896 [Takifugu bimaculatus]